MSQAPRIALKVSWMAVLILLLAMFGREVVGFVYTGF
jgi:hypothetical protein